MAGEIKIRLPPQSNKATNQQASPPNPPPPGGGPERPEAGGISPRRESKSAGGPTRPKGGNPPRRELDPPEAPCQANRKEGAGATGNLARPLGAIPQQGQPPNQALSNHTMRLRLSPMQKNRAQAVQAALGERSPSD